MTPITEELHETIKWKKVMNAIHDQIPNKLNFKVFDDVFDMLVANIIPIINVNKRELKNKL